MEQEKPLAENQIDGRLAGNEETAESGSLRQSENAAAGADDSGITDQEATIRIEGQEFPLEAAYARDDKLLKTILQPHFSSIENANITREVKNGKLTVSIVKRAQHKG